VRRGIVILSLLLAAVVGCIPTPAGHDEQLTVDDGIVTVHVPGSHGRIGVIVLHSYAHSGTEMVAQGWSKAADKHGFIAIYPDRGTSWDAGLCCGYAATTSRDDVSWLATVVTTVRLKYGLDTIYLAGNSNGGMMVERLLAERPDISNAFAVWGSAPEMPTAGTWTGRGYLYDGVGDTTVPWKGGTLMIGGIPTLIRPSQTTDRWLVGAHLHGTIEKGYGHAPQAGWPELAWKALAS
jgi:poly(3-hydroxybutyrate) depolymerase